MKTIFLTLTIIASLGRTMHVKHWFILCLGCFVCFTGRGYAEEKSLHLAIRRGDSLACRKLLEEGADLNARDSKGNFPLHLTTIEPVNPMKDFPSGKELITLWVEKQNENQRGSTSQEKPFKELTVDFHTEIQPIFERSCIDCHSGDRAKGALRMNSRQALLDGGQSKQSAIEPGNGIQSPLIRFATDQVEDLEMPPFGKRKKYPALTTEEISKLTVWINEGAPWPEELVLE